MILKPLKLGVYATDVTSAPVAFRVCLGLLAEHSDSASTYIRRAQTWTTVNLMSRVLNRWVPPFSYWGHHPSDMTQYGVWIDLGKLHQAEEWGKLVQAASLKAAKSGVYVLVAEADGLALYHRRTGTELWRTT